MLDHFVTVRAESGSVILEAMFDEEINCDHITWVRVGGGPITPGAVGNDPLTASAPRTGTQEGGLNVGERIEIRIECDQIVIWTGVVWVVWANVSMTNPETTQEVAIHEETVKQIPKRGKDGQPRGRFNGEGLQLTASASATQVESIEFQAQITPTSMFDVDEDVPALHRIIAGDIRAGKIKVPNGDERPLTKQKRQLKEGVQYLWDMSRAVKVRAINPNRYSREDLPYSEKLFDKLVADPDADPPKPVPDNIVLIPYPNEAVVGNDDPHFGGQKTPYKDELGVLTISDAPGLPLPDSLGQLNEEFQLRTNFRIFVRLYLGGKWVMVSEPADNAGLCRVHLRFVKVDAGDNQTRWARHEASLFDQTNDPQ